MNIPEIPSCAVCHRETRHMYEVMEKELTTTQLCSLKCSVTYQKLMFAIKKYMDEAALIGKHRMDEFYKSYKQKK